MKSKEEIEQLAEQYIVWKLMDEAHASYIAFQDGYTQCQEDMADKRYTEEDLMSAFNAGINNDYGNGPSFDQWLNSLNKQD